MRVKKIGMIAIVLLSIAIALTFSARSLSAQPSGVVRSSGGFHLEEVKVGGSCVVVVWRPGTGASDYLAAVPCK